MEWSPEATVLSFRITRHADLSGIGGIMSPARWHSGRRIIYASDTYHTALLETHHSLAPQPDDPFEDVFEYTRYNYWVLKIAITTPAKIQDLSRGSLPHGWNLEESEGGHDICRPIGNRWLDDQASPVLKVPSARSESACNYLINPAHPDMRWIQVSDKLQSPLPAAWA